MFSFLRKIFGREQRDAGDGGVMTYEEVFGTPSTNTNAGQTVNASQAMRLTTFHACVRLLSETIASLPLNVYRRDGDRKEIARDHYLHKLLHDESHSALGMSAMTYREICQSHLCIYGNSYTAYERTRSGRVLFLQPVHPNNVEVEIEGKKITYKIDRKPWPTDQMLHVKALATFDGITGIAPVAYLRQTLGAALASEEYGQRFFVNDGTSQIVAEMPGKVDPDDKKRFREEWKKYHTGENRHMPAIADQGVKIHTLDITPEDLQFLESRKFSVEEIARIFRIPLVLIGHTEKTTSWGTGVEQLMIGFVTHTLRPWFVRWEQEVNRTLLTKAERQEYFVEFNAEGLLRGDIKTRYEAYHIGINDGLMTRETVQNIENLPTYTGSDKPLIPMNMQLLDENGKPIAEEPDESGNVQQMNTGAA